MVVVISTNYYLLAPCVILMFVLWRIRNFYVKSARDIKRLDSISEFKHILPCMSVKFYKLIDFVFYMLARSPVFMHLSQTVQGLSTIRGLETEQVVVDQFDSYLVNMNYI